MGAGNSRSEAPGQRAPAGSSLVILDRMHHAGSHWRPAAADECPALPDHVPLALAEIGGAAAVFPLAFNLAGGAPLALMRLPGQAVSPFAPAGLWMAPMRPAGLATPPFALVSGAAAGSGGQSLAIAASALCDAQTGLPLFTERGELGAEAAALVAPLRHHAVALTQAAAATALLAELDLLVPFGNGESGLANVELPRLDGLEEAALLRLHRLGLLALIHAHAVSLAHLPWMARAVPPPWAGATDGRLRDAPMGQPPERRLPMQAQSSAAAFLAAFAADGAAAGGPGLLSGRHRHGHTLPAACLRAIPAFRTRKDPQ